MPQVKTPGQPVSERVIVYVDGFNLYFGIRSSGLGRYLWLDLCALGKSLLRHGQNLVAVRYFTSRVSGPEHKRQRQTAYLDALATLDRSVLSVAYGNYQLTPFTCHQCGRESDVSNEKQTDVNIAVAMMADAFQNQFDVALLVSADSDLCPAVHAIRKLFPAKRIVACFPPGRFSKELASVVSAYYSIGHGKLKGSQFPPVIKTAEGFMLRKPALWDEPDYQKPH